MVRSQLRVLIVQGSPADVSAIVEVLQQGERELLHWTVSGVEALHWALDKQPWDCVIYVHGADRVAEIFEALCVVIQSGADIPFFTVAPAIGEETVAELMRAGVSGFVLRRNIRNMPQLLERELHRRASRMKPPLVAAERINNGRHVRLLLENVPILAAYMDWKERYVFASRRYAEAFGCRQVEVVGRHLREIIGERNYLAVQERVKACLSGEVASSDQLYTMPTGEPIWFRVNYVPDFDLAGRVIGFCEFAMNIGRRKMAEEELDKSETKYRELVENANSIILRLDRRGRITFLNEFAQRFFGYTKEEIIGRSAVGTIVPETETGGRDLRRLIDEICADPERFAVNENENIRRNHERVWIAWTNKALYDADGNVAEILCVGNDVTERRRAEQDRDRLRRQLLNLQKMEAVGTLAGGIAHDLNNVLGIIVGYSELAKLGTQQGTTARNSIEQVLKAAHRGANQIRQVILFSGTDLQRNRCLLDINRLVERTVASLRASVPANIEIHLDVPETSSEVCADKNQIELLLTSLCTNAAQALEPLGGLLEVHAHDIDLTRADIPPGSKLKPGPHVRLMVRDTGCGMDSATLQRIFDPYFTTKGLGRGCGLGLSVAFGIAVCHEGHIAVQSEVGKGSTFFVYLPRVLNAMAGSGRS